MKYDGFPDAELFELFVKGNVTAFNAIYERYFGVLLNTSYKRLGSREEAQEIVQDLFINFFLKRSAIENTSNLSAYLHTLLRNKIIDRYREYLTRQKHLHALKHHQFATVEEMPGTAIDNKLLESTIATTIDQLPEKCRKVFIMSRLNNLSHQAIAEKLTISVSTVEKHIGKALKIMREQVEKYNLNSILLIVLCQV